jgi:hypothetical protein
MKASKGPQSAAAKSNHDAFVISGETEEEMQVWIDVLSDTADRVSLYMLLDPTNV